MKVQPELVSSYKELPSNKKLYFASDFHLGIKSDVHNLERERKIVRWLEHVSKDASAIFLVGDIFDFWFEYKNTVPKGFVRFLGKLAELCDQGIHIQLFVGNHDLWIKDYLPSQIGVKVHHNPIVLEVGNKRLFVGHGDGLGPGDVFYKIVKKIFTNRFCNWLFLWIHPNIGVSLAKFWSEKSRIKSRKKVDVFKGENEPLLHYCRTLDAKLHHDMYIFGHRHLPLELPVSDTSTYFNLGEWVTQFNYLEFDGEHAELKTFKG